MTTKFKEAFDRVPPQEKFAFLSALSCSKDSFAIGVFFRELASDKTIKSPSFEVMMNYLGNHRDDEALLKAFEMRKRDSDAVDCFVRQFRNRYSSSREVLKAMEEIAFSGEYKNVCATTKKNAASVIGRCAPREELISLWQRVSGAAGSSVIPEAERGELLIAVCKLHDPALRPSIEKAATSWYLRPEHKIQAAEEYVRFGHTEPIPYLIHCLAAGTPPKYGNGLDSLFLKGSPLPDSLEDQYARRSLNALFGDPATRPLVIEGLKAGFRSNLPPTDRARASDFMRLLPEAEKLGINNPFRFEPSTLAALVNERTNPVLDERPVALLIFPKTDHNGAFAHSRNSVTELIRHGYRVMYHEARSDKDMKEVLDAATDATSRSSKKTALVILAGHGSKESLAFDETKEDEGELSLSDRAMFAGADYSLLLEKGGKVILNSCSTGKDGKSADNVATFVRTLFPAVDGEIVVAPMIPAGSILLRFGPDNRVNKVLFKDIPECEILLTADPAGPPGLPTG